MLRRGVEPDLRAFVLGERGVGPGLRGLTLGPLREGSRFFKHPKDHLAFFPPPPML
jgi:hypothetical protein